MIHTPAAVAVPLRRDSDGVIRIGETRLTLAVLLNTYKQGYTAEELHEAYDVATLPQIYAVIAYYHANQEMLDAYLAEVEAEGDRIRAEIEASRTPEQIQQDKALMQRIEALREKRKQDS